MATKQLTNERKFDLMEKWGFTDAELADVLNDGESEDEVDEDDGISELATNMGYIWSFKLSRWFDKNQGGLDEDKKDFDALLDEIRDEDERK